MYTSVFVRVYNMKMLFEIKHSRKICQDDDEKRIWDQYIGNNSVEYPSERS